MVHDRRVWRGTRPAGTPVAAVPCGCAERGRLRARSGFLRRQGRHDLKRIILLVVIGTGIYLARPEQVEDLAADASRAVSESVEDVTGKTAKDISDHALSQLRRDNLERALRQYENLRGKEPEELEDLVREGLVNKADLVDEWGRGLKVEVTTRGIVVRSAGRDGRFHTRDDWTLGES